jgi:hypothetical protein
MPTIWTDYKAGSARYFADGVPPRAAVEQFAEEEFGHPTAWAWAASVGYEFKVAIDPQARLFRLRLVGLAGEQLFVIQVEERR